MPVRARPQLRFCYHRSEDKETDVRYRDRRLASTDLKKVILRFRLRHQILMKELSKQVYVTISNTL